MRVYTFREIDSLALQVSLHLHVRVYTFREKNSLALQVPLHLHVREYTFREKDGLDLQVFLIYLPAAKDKGWSTSTSGVVDFTLSDSLGNFAFLTNPQN